MSFDLFVIWLGVVSGNFLYQWIFNQEWDVAFERSFFQTYAFICVWLFVI